eukprot:Blabericola_migrator_1__794@NODE_119_length_13646_cov_70_025112_g107_i0_p11_GENE_NODE_119_length_13646_cov_70_025112_g107_i0NODE_119_length_13646_cov_70_025112_g107_i0_p11_ORF_typecomplete_len127_score31_72_NODE_119_length_13646_cov_70_025112_g107_i080908470
MPPRAPSRKRQASNAGPPAKRARSKPKRGASRSTSVSQRSKAVLLDPANELEMKLIKVDKEPIKTSVVITVPWGCKHKIKNNFAAQWSLMRTQNVPIVPRVVCDGKPVETAVACVSEQDLAQVRTV